MRWKPALNAFAITFEGRITPNASAVHAARHVAMATADSSFLAAAAQTA